MDLGRKAEISFADDMLLAHRHARFIRASDGGIDVIPLEQWNGIYRRIHTRTPLSDEQMMLIGRQVFRFEHVGPDEDASTALIQHGVARMGSPDRGPWGRLSQCMANGGVRDIRYLCERKLTIGREEGDILFADDAFLSRRHVTLSRRDGGGAWIEDQGSSNGTFVRIEGKTRVQMGDELRIGDQLLRITAAPASDAGTDGRSES